NTISAGKVWKGEFCNKRKDGSTFWESATITPVKNNSNEITSYIAIKEDVTERKEIKALLDKQNKFLSGIIESLPYPFYVISCKDYKIKYSNKAGGSLRKVSLCSEIGNHIGIDTNACSKSCPIKNNFDYAPRVYQAEKNGETIYYEQFFHPIHNDEGQVTEMVEYFIDITERVEIERKMQASEKRFKELVRLLPQTVFEVDENDQLTFMNQYGLEEFRYTVDDITAGINLNELVHPNERIKIKKNKEQLLKNQPLVFKEMYMLDSNGRSFMARIFVSGIQEEGHYLGVRGIILDISAVKETEFQLYKERSLLKSLINSIPDMIYYKSAQTGEFLGCNESFEKFSEIQGRSIIGRKPSSLFSKETLELVEYADEKVLKQGQQERKTIDCKEYDKHFDLIKAPYVHNGEINGTIGIMRDVTEQMRNKMKIQRQKEEIEYQKEEIEKQHDFVIQQRDQIIEQNKEITDSIMYASRIQSALFPEDEILSDHLQDHFILNKPKNIVSGDFYWMAKNGSRIILAVADSTGHGVPGAFMSLLGITYLSEIVANNQNLSANIILDQLREKVINSLHQTGERGDVQDGMDIAMFIYDYENKDLEYAGANNPLYIVRKRNHTNGAEALDLPDTERCRVSLENGKAKLIELRPDKIPIGIHENRDGFLAHKIKMQDDDCVYLFSDGYVDQFGGRDGKKFKFAQFRRLLMSVQDKPMKDQRFILDSTFENWMNFPGKYILKEQVDDVLIIGVKI
ncbi:MAG: hypothetical protein C0594_03665, partial [Marinilabiliales bacterium]